MNHLWRNWFIFIVLVIIIPHSCAIRHHDLMNDENESLPSDFVDFVKSLDKMVFNKDHKKNKTETDATTKQRKRRTHATKNMKFRRSNANLKSSQNSALRDILMLKLVSYYEDKYKVSQDDYTTHRALEPLYRAPAEPLAEHAAEHVQEHAAEPPDEVRSVGSPLLAADDSDRHVGYRRKIWYPDTTKYHENTDDNTLDQITPEAKQTFADVVVL